MPSRRGVTLSSQLGGWVKSPSEIRGRAQAAKAFLWIFSCKNASGSINFHHFCAGKKCWNCSSARGNDTFAPVVPKVPGHFSAAPLESAPMMTVTTPNMQVYNTSHATHCSYAVDAEIAIHCTNHTCLSSHKTTESTRVVRRPMLFITCELR